RTTQGGISLAPPPELAPGLQRVPPMLHSDVQRPMASYSKGAWGLFVLSRGLGILTETAISPSTWSRQCPSRYAIRAGRNLPDKEFRFSSYSDMSFSDNLPNGIALPLMRLPACRHAAGTISRPCVQGLWRMVSEDSDQLVPGFTPVHRSCDISDLEHSRRRQ